MLIFSSLPCPCPAPKGSGALKETSPPVHVCQWTSSRGPDLTPGPCALPQILEVLPPRFLCVAPHPQNPISYAEVIHNGCYRCHQLPVTLCMGASPRCGSFSHKRARSGRELTHQENPSTDEGQGSVVKTPAVLPRKGPFGSVLYPVSQGAPSRRASIAHSSPQAPI